MGIGKDVCLECGLHRTKQGHDGCLGTLPGDVMNACCGHGNIPDAYIQFNHPDYNTNPNKHRLAGADAIKKMEELKPIVLPRDMKRRPNVQFIDDNLV